MLTRQLRQTSSKVTVVCVITVVVPLGPETHSMVLLDFRSKKYCFCLSSVHFNVSFFFFHGLVNRVLSLRSVLFGNCDVPPVYSDHLANRLPLVSPDTKYFSMESVQRITCPNYFSFFFIVVIVFRECLDSFY